VLIGIDQAYMREYNEQEDKEKLLFNSLIIPLINTVIVSIILILFKEFWAKLLFSDSNYTLPVVLLAICSPLFIIEKFMLLSIRMEEKAFKYSLWNILSKLFNLICLVLLLLFYKRTFESVIYATIIAQATISIILIFICRKKIKVSIKYLDTQLVNVILKYSLPLLPATLIGYGLNSMDTVFLRVMTDFNELGYYSVALKIVTLLTLVQTSFTTFWSPMALKWKAEGKENSKYELVGKGVSLGMGILLIIILMFKNLIPLIINSEYAQVIYILPFLLFHPIFYTISETTTLGISFSRKTGYNVIVSIVSLVVNLILNALLIPKLGAVGAAVATGISYLVFFWTRTIISRKLWYKFPIKHFFIDTIILATVAYVNTCIKNIILVEIINILAMIILIVNYKDIISLLISLKRKERKA